MTQCDAVYHKHPASKFIHFPPVCAARPLVAAEPRGSRVQCLRMNFAPGLGPPPPCSCSVPCVIVYSIKTSLLIRQHLVHFRTVPDSTDTHTQNTHTVGTQFAAVLRAFFLLKNGSSITPLSEKTANGSREPTNAYMLRTIMQMCAETTLVA